MVFLVFSKFFIVVVIFGKFVFLFLNLFSILLMVCVKGRFVVGVLMRCVEIVDVWIVFVFSLLFVMLICGFELFWILFRFCLRGSWMLFLYFWLFVDKGCLCIEIVGKRKFSDVL